MTRDASEVASRAYTVVMAESPSSRRLAQPVPAGVTLDTRPRMRPRFKLCSPVPPGTLEAAVKARLRETGEFRGLILPERIELNLLREEQRFWSPQLTIDVRFDPSLGTTCLYGRFGPHPHVWTMYMALYALVGMVALGALIFAAAQWTIGQAPTALLVLPLAAFAAFLVWGIPFIGQGFAQDDMFRLRHFLVDAASAVPHPDELEAEGPFRESDAAA